MPPARSGALHCRPPSPAETGIGGYVLRHGPRPLGLDSTYAPAWFFAASHLAWCGRTPEALRLLERAIRGGYCSWPVIDTDPYFAGVRARPEFASLRATAVACQKAFLAATGPGTA